MGFSDYTYYYHYLTEVEQCLNITKYQVVCRQVWRKP